MALTGEASIRPPIIVSSAFSCKNKRTTLTCYVNSTVNKKTTRDFSTVQSNVVFSRPSLLTTTSDRVQLKT